LTLSASSRNSDIQRAFLFASTFAVNLRRLQGLLSSVHFRRPTTAVSLSSQAATNVSLRLIAPAPLGS